MKQMIYILAALILLRPTLSAQTAAKEQAPAARETWFSSSLETSAGFFYGTTSEFVYEGDRVLSRLDWQEYFIPYLSLAGTFEVKNFIFYLNLTSGLPGKGGAMEDYDFLDPAGTAHTHYSRHNAELENHLEINPSIGYRFRLRDFGITPAVNFTYQTRTWAANDGYTQYPGQGKRSMAGEVITYEETAWFPGISLALDYTFWGRLGVSVEGCFYPYMEFNTIDTHILRLTRFYDAIKGGTGGYAGLSLRYNPTHSGKMGFTAAVAWEGVYSRKGTISSGAVGYGEPDALVVSRADQSRIESSIWWFSLGTVFYPEKLWQ
jgi:outer membrane protease